ncbi:hypothetical protein CesoFtcFv8_021684 [Champsocephalus esox]|uniref:Uncharacterized protein n=1 Tax=Champsocephalus esox TaxID=159716 RepID=A0AAN8BA94_9TELE|nr:hypothetical protein CesoFtcFv8_021684 [Champsocephalus esox]
MLTTVPPQELRPLVKDLVDQSVVRSVDRKQRVNSVTQRSLEPQRRFRPQICHQEEVNRWGFWRDNVPSRLSDDFVPRSVTKRKSIAGDSG